MAQDAGGRSVGEGAKGRAGACSSVLRACTGWMPVQPEHLHTALLRAGCLWTKHLSRLCLKEHLYVVMVPHTDQQSLLQMLLRAAAVLGKGSLSLNLSCVVRQKLSSRVHPTCPKCQSFAYCSHSLCCLWLQSDERDSSSAVKEQQGVQQISGSLLISRLLGCLFQSKGLWRLFCLFFLLSFSCWSFPGVCVNSI